MRLYVRAIMYIFYISRAAVYRILRVMARFGFTFTTFAS